MILRLLKTLMLYVFVSPVTLDFLELIIHLLIHITLVQSEIKIISPDEICFWNNS